MHQPLQGEPWAPESAKCLGKYYPLSLTGVKASWPRSASKPVTPPGGTPQQSASQPIVLTSDQNNQQRRKLHCEAADGANLKTTYCTETLPGQKYQQKLGVYYRTYPKRAHTPPQTYNKATLLMQLFQNLNATKHLFGGIFNPQTDARPWRIFCLTQQVASRGTAKTRSNSQI